MANYGRFSIHQKHLTYPTIGSKVFEVDQKKWTTAFGFYKFTRQTLSVYYF